MIRFLYIVGGEPIPSLPEGLKNFRRVQMMMP
jgi:hypothetical protein